MEASKLRCFDVTKLRKYPPNIPVSKTPIIIPFPKLDFSQNPAYRSVFFNPMNLGRERDHHCEMMLGWVQDQPYYKRSNDWDHFLTMGRITWDFRRSKDHDWDSRCIYMSGMQNITCLLIERNLWDYFDVGVPYPTGFHPRSNSDVIEWQRFIRERNRPSLFSFAGATRGAVRNDFRGLLLRQCNETDTCTVVNCAKSRCSNGTSAILETFLGSELFATAEFAPAGPK
jgi:hypothetical protein